MITQKNLLACILWHPRTMFAAILDINCSSNSIQDAMFFGIKETYLEFLLNTKELLDNSFKCYEPIPIPYDLKILISLNSRQLFH